MKNYVVSKNKEISTTNTKKEKSQDISRHDTTKAQKSVHSRVSF